MTRNALHLNVLVLLLAVFFVSPRSTQAIGDARQLPTSFVDFSRTVQNGDADVLRGVYVADVLELPVVQQPEDKPYYVSDRNGEATQFSMASQYGSIGLLAHNTLSGRYFSSLAIGQEVRLVYGNGRTESYVVQQILRFQALDPQSVSSSFRNLDRDEVLSANEMFNRVYAGEHRVIFQTCIAAGGNASWGRLFVVAMPAP